VRSKASPFTQTTIFVTKDSVNNFSSVAPTFHVTVVVSQQLNYSTLVFHNSLD